MADYVSTLRADTSQHDRALSDASKKVGDYKKETDKASASINGMKDATSRSTRELMKEMSTMENLGRSTSNYKRQLADITKQISDLTINYRNMSEEQKNGAFGQEVAAKIEELKNKAAEYKDAIGDVSAEIQRLSSDTANWDSMKQGIDVVSSSLQAFVATGVLGEQSTERLVAVIAKLKAVETATNAVIKIGNALQKNSALMLGVTKVQALAAAKAKTLEGNATAVATVKQKAFNLVAKANPYVLLATAVIGVVTALAAFSKGQDEATKSMYNANEMNKAYKDKLNEVAGEVGLTIGKFESLKSQYEKLKSVGEKQEWINKNKTAFNDLGLSVTSVNDADNIFIKNSDKVIKAMQLRAQAAAIQQLYQEKYAEAYQKSIKVAEGRSSSFAPSTFFRRDWRKAGLSDGDFTMTTTTPLSVGAIPTTLFELTPEGVAKMQAYWEQQGANVMSSFTEGAAGMIDDMTAMIREAESLESSFKTTTTTTTTSGKQKEEIKALEGSITYIKNQISETQKLRDAAVVGTDEWWNQVHALEALNEQLEEAEAKQRRLTSNFEPLAPISNPITAQAQGPAIKLAGKNPYEKLQEQLAEFEKFYEKTMENIAGYSDVFNSIGTICSNLSGVLGEEGAAWMQFGAQVAQSVSKMLPQIASLVLANQAAAIAEGTASSASLPFPGNLVAIASIVAELIAIFAAIPKFAEGGIIGGSNSIGDYNIARVNSGEMILNGTQQAKLFNMINTGGLYGSDEGTGSVSFKIRGNDLVGVLNNYNRKLAKR
jgi:hypothetical protein